MKAEAILRESSEKQVQDDRQGLEDQRSEITDFATESGMEIVNWETVVESATHWDRPIWESVIDDVVDRHRRGEVDAIIFDRVDRETRNLFASMPILDRVLRAGIKVYFAAESFELDPRDPEAQNKYLKGAVRAIGYRETISDNWKRVHHRRAGKDLHPTNQRLFGFCYDENEKRVLDEAVVPIARQAVQMFLRGRALSPVVRWLQNDHRIAALNSPSALRRWLQNPGLKGETHTCGKVIQHQALVSPEVWEEIQAVLEHNRGCRAPRKGYLPIPFFCSCGARMRAERHDTRVYIRCRSRSCSGQRYLRLDRFKSMLSLATIVYVQEKRHLFGDVQVKAEIRQRVIADLDEVTKALNGLKAKWGALVDLKLEQKMGEWRGPKEILEKKEESLISQQETLEDKQVQLLDQLRELPEIEVVDVQMAWDEIMKPYEVHFSPALNHDPPTFDEQSPDGLALRLLLQTVPSFYQINNLRPSYPNPGGPPPRDGMEIPEPLCVQGADIPSSGWGSHGWDPPEEFRRVVPPSLEAAVWDLLRDLRAEAFLDRGRLKLRFQLKVTPRRLNKTPSCISPC